MLRQSIHGKGLLMPVNLVSTVMTLKYLIGIAKELKAAKPAWKPRSWIGQMILPTLFMI